jgi:hypothetical protein
MNKLSLRNIELTQTGNINDSGIENMVKNALDMSFHVSAPVY